MNFVDNVSVVVTAGSGGNGCVSFRREKFVDRGGPDGGDGGRGGNVMFVASRNQNTLARFRFQTELRAQPGGAGDKRRKHGKNGEDLIAQVPVGTVVMRDDSIVADMVEDGQRTIIAAGGRGGFGNAHFVSSTRQAPRFAERGETGDSFKARLELKMIADVGVVGLPNAGKSTLLSRISAARPEIADYPFTTLVPNLGVVDVDNKTSLLFADIPGLIAGASQGKGLGHEFLRHIERTTVILHLIDVYQPDVAMAYRIIRDELASYDAQLAKRPQVVVLNKIDGLDSEMLKQTLDQLRTVVPKSTPLLAISAQAGTNLKDLLFKVKDLVQKSRLRSARTQTKASEQLPVHRLEPRDDAWTIEKYEDEFIIRGDKIEGFARRTDFNNPEAAQRLRSIMQKMGIMHELTRQGIKSGQAISFSRHGKLLY